MNRQGTIVLSANTSWYLYNFRKELVQALIADEFDVVVLAPFDRWDLPTRAPSKLVGDQPGRLLQGPDEKNGRLGFCSGFMILVVGRCS